jgi:LmbE family N-acetylglucosaminyl deacetylase
MLVCTRGQVGTRPEPIDSPELLGRVREYETRAAAKVLGIRDLTFLDYMDGQLDQADPAELASHVVQAIERSAADAVISFGPHGITKHPDHIACHQAALAGAQRSTRPVRLYYVALPDEFAKRFEIDGPETEPTHRIEMADYFETKLTALACHFSQQDAREFFLMLSQGTQTEELFHQALPPYDGEGLSGDLLA